MKRRVLIPNPAGLSRRDSLRQMVSAAGLSWLSAVSARAEDKVNSSSKPGGAEGRVAGGTEQPLQRVRFKDRDDEQTVEGRVLVQATDGGLLLEDRGGRLWSITPDRLLERSSDGDTFTPLSAEQTAQRLIEEADRAGIPGEFVSHQTGHYVLVTNTDVTYARWVGGLLERLQRALRTFWKARDLALHDPEFPLPVLILAQREQFGQMAVFDRTPGSAQGHGYYFVTANRTVLYDLTRDNGAAPAGSLSDIQARVQRSPASVATVVHEATHQIAFNCGLHRRYADNPVWLTEGMAMYFETPDLQNRSGWQTIGRVNRSRLQQFQEFVRSDRKPDSLSTLVRDNQRFADVEQAVAAYAEAWALTHFLIRQRSRFYNEFVHRTAQKPLLKFDTPDQRLRDFTDAFGSVEELDRDFLSFVRRL